MQESYEVVGEPTFRSPSRSLTSRRISIIAGSLALHALIEKELIGGKVVKPEEPKVTCPYSGEQITIDELKTRVDARKAENSLVHPYDELLATLSKRYTRCVKEIEDFFQHEKARNLDEAAKGIVPTDASKKERSHQWLQFWTGIRQLDLMRYNDSIAEKKRLRNERRGKQTGSKPLRSKPAKVKK